MANRTNCPSSSSPLSHPTNKPQVGQLLPFDQACWAGRLDPTRTGSPTQPGHPSATAGAQQDLHSASNYRSRAAFLNLGHFKVCELKTPRVAQPATPDEESWQPRSTHLTQLSRSDGSPGREVRAGRAAEPPWSFWVGAPGSLQPQGSPLPSLCSSARLGSARGNKAGAGGSDPLRAVLGQAPGGAWREAAPFSLLLHRDTGWHSNRGPPPSLPPAPGTWTPP